MVVAPGTFRVPASLAVAAVLFSGCTVDAGLDPPDPGPTASPTPTVPVLPDPTAVQRLLGEVYDQPEQHCTDARAWQQPPPFPYGVACLARGDLSDLSPHESRTIALFVYPPPELTLQGTSPVVRWLASSTYLLGDNRLDACRDWEPIMLDGGEGLRCIERGWGTVISDAARVAAASDTVLVIVDVTAELVPPYNCDALLNPAECPEVDVAYLEDLAFTTAQRLLTMVG